MGHDERGAKEWQGRVLKDNKESSAGQIVKNIDLSQYW